MGTIVLQVSRFWTKLVFPKDVLKIHRLDDTKVKQVQIF
jgi:hypothetical protein